MRRSTPPASSSTDELGKLQQLLEAGALTLAKFEAAKAGLLSPYDARLVSTTAEPRFRVHQRHQVRRLVG